MEDLSNKLKAPSSKYEDILISCVTASPRDFKVKLRVASTQAEVTWEKPSYIHYAMLEGYCVLVSGRKNFEQMIVDSHGNKVLVELVPSVWYEVTVSAISTANKVLASKTFRFKAVLSRAELTQLHQMAVDFLRTKPPRNVSLQDRMIQCHCFYRCKPRSYWQECVKTNFTMKKYLKDGNGQPGNPINKVIPGLFFAAKMERNGSLSTWSFYGSVQCRIPCLRLFHPNSRLYFCDFYCNYRTHYVTLLITERGSDSDIFCEQHLVELNIYNNEFLCMKADPYSPGGYKFWLNNTMCIEFYYTEDVLCFKKQNFCCFERVQPMGKGSSTPGGLQNNKECSICNLYPQKSL